MDDVRGGILRIRRDNFRGGYRLSLSIGGAGGSSSIELELSIEEEMEIIRMITGARHSDIELPGLMRDVPWRSTR